MRIPQRSVETAFAAAVGRNSLDINAVSVAAVHANQATITTSPTQEAAGGPCALCVLGPGLALDGQNGDISVTGGNVVVNSDPPSGSAADLKSNGHIRVLDERAKIGGPGAPGKFTGSGYSPAPELAPAGRRPAGARARLRPQLGVPD